MFSQISRHLRPQVADSSAETCHDVSFRRLGCLPTSCQVLSVHGECVSQGQDMISKDLMGGRPAGALRHGCKRGCDGMLQQSGPVAERRREPAVSRRSCWLLRGQGPERGGRGGPRVCSRVTNLEERRMDARRPRDRTRGGACWKQLRHTT